MPPCCPPSYPGQHFDFPSPRSSHCDGRVGGGCSREPARAHFFRSRLPFSRGVLDGCTQRNRPLLPARWCNLIEIFNTLFVFVCLPSSHRRDFRAVPLLLSTSCLRPIISFFSCTHTYAHMHTTHEHTRISFPVNYRYDLAETRVPSRELRELLIPIPLYHSTTAALFVDFSGQADERAVTYSNNGDNNNVNNNNNNSSNSSYLFTILFRNSTAPALSRPKKNTEIGLFPPRKVIGNNFFFS